MYSANVVCGVGVHNIIQVLEQVSPKPGDVLCQTAMLYLDKNRTTNYLPRKCACIFFMLTKSRHHIMCVYFSADEYRVLLKGTPSYIHASFAHVSWHGIYNIHDIALEMLHSLCIAGLPPEACLHHLPGTHGGDVQRLLEDGV